MELCRRRPGSRQEGTVEETVVNTPLTVTGTITDIHTKTGQTMTGKAGVKDVPADHLTEKDTTLTDVKEIMQTAEKDPEAKETAKAVPLKEEALPEPPAETPEPEKEKPAGLNPAAIVLLLALLGGGGVFAYLKLVKNKPKTKGNDSLDDYDYGEEDSEEWETEDEESDEPDADGGSTEEDDEDSVK